MPVVYRNARDKIQVQSLDLQIMLDDMFAVAKDVKELDFLEEALIAHVEGAREEAEGYLEEV